MILFQRKINYYLALSLLVPKIVKTIDFKLLKILATDYKDSKD
tara:strand:+ start:361 stop:489 length:129 start_codon:yes stop_codon:yes gene_type:complete